MSKESIEKKTEELLAPILDENNFELVDVEYVKEGSDWYLRAYIDKEGGININDCEKVSRALDPVLDECNFIPDAYTLEISSPGLTRPLKKERDYERNLGRPVEIKLYRALDGEKIFVGTLKDYSAGSVTIEDENGNSICFEKKDVALIRQYFEF